MKVLHICNNFISSTVHQKMAEYSRKIGIKNTVFAPVVTLEGRVTPQEDEYAVRCVNQIDRFFFFHKQKKTYRSLQKTVTPSSYDCVHTHCVFTDGNVALNLKKNLGLPYIVTINNTDLNHFFRLRVLLRSRGIHILKEASHIIYISNSYQKTLLERYIPKKYHAQLKEKSSIIPFGINDYWLENLYPLSKELLSNHQLRLVYAGDICTNKNLETTVSAIELLQAEGWKITFDVAGKVLDEALFQRLQSKSFIRYAGLISKECLLELYRQNDIFVMPSFTDTFGLVYAEALSQGLPIIYTQGQGFDEQFPEGYVGYHVNPSQPEAVAKAILRIVKEYSSIQKNCATAAKKFSWDAIAQQYKTIYTNIAAERK